VGDIILADTLLMYAGPFKDYSSENKLLASGAYAINGKKDGFFTFYYPSGIIQASGTFSQDSLLGMWRWNYPDGNERATVYFPGIEQEFKIITYKDERGRTTLENGTGEFVWQTNPIDAYSVQQVRGYFIKGRREGKWIYTYPKAESDFLNVYERYDTEGKFVNGGGITYSNNRVIKKPTAFRFSPIRLRAWESMSVDNIFSLNGDQRLSYTLLKYLSDKNSLEVDMQKIKANAVFETIMKVLVNVMNPEPNSFVYNESKIDFNIGSNGRLVNIYFTSFNNRQKIYLQYILEKFRNIQSYNPNSRLYTVFVNSFQWNKGNFHTETNKIKFKNRFILSSLPKGQMDYVFKNVRIFEKHAELGYFIWQP
jgi:antitoxin component YwqK of YwqJK toxin-antitoxin module